jgi:hypothetical protein
MISAYKYTPDDPMLIQNEKPKSLRRMSYGLNISCCKFVVKIVVQTPQESKTKEKIMLKQDHIYPK